MTNLGVSGFEHDRQDRDFDRLSDRVQENNDAIIRLGEQVRILSEQFKDLKDTNKTDFKKIQEDQTKTQDLFNQGRGALFILTLLGGLVGIMLTWGKDLLKPWIPMP